LKGSRLDSAKRGSKSLLGRQPPPVLCGPGCEVAFLWHPSPGVRTAQARSEGGYMNSFEPPPDSPQSPADRQVPPEASGSLEALGQRMRECLRARHYRTARRLRQPARRPRRRRTRASTEAAAEGRSARTGSMRPRDRRRPPSRAAARRRRQGPAGARSPLRGSRGHQTGVRGSPAWAPRLPIERYAWRALKSAVKNPLISA